MLITLEILNAFILISSYLSVLILASAILQNLTSKSTNLLQYKIRNIYIGWFFAFTYLSIFIILFYLLRLFTVGKSIDLKEYFSICLTFIKSQEIININFILISLIIVMTAYIFVMQKINKFFLNNLVKLYLFLEYKHDPQKNKLNDTKFSNLISRFGKNFNGTDPLSYFIFHKIPDILISRFMYYLDVVWRNEKRTFNKWIRSEKPTKNHKLYFNMLFYCFYFIFRKPYYWFVTLSPIILIIIEIILNNFVIHYVFYFLLFYVPLILLRKLFVFFENENMQLTRMLWIIYYIKLPRIFALPKEPENIKILWELFLMNNLQSLGFEVTKQFSEDMLFEFNFFEFIRHIMEFYSYNNETNLYTNSQIIVELVDGKLYKVKYEEIRKDVGEYEEIKTLEEEWLIIYDNIHQ